MNNSRRAFSIEGLSLTLFKRPQRISSKNITLLPGCWHQSTHKATTLHMGHPFGISTLTTNRHIILPYYLLFIRFILLNCQRVERVRVQVKWFRERERERKSDEVDDQTSRPLKLMDIRANKRIELRGLGYELYSEWR